MVVRTGQFYPACSPRVGVAIFPHPEKTRQPQVLPVWPRILCVHRGWNLSLQSSPPITTATPDSRHLDVPAQTLCLDPSVGELHPPRSPGRCQCVTALGLYPIRIYSRPPGRGAAGQPGQVEILYHVVVPVGTHTLSPSGDRWPRVVLSRLQLVLSQEWRGVLFIDRVNTTHTIYEHLGILETYKLRALSALFSSSCYD